MSLKDRNLHRRPFPTPKVKKRKPMNKHQFQLQLSAISSIKSPDLDVIPGHSRRRISKGESPFFTKSEKGYTCLDFGPDGTQTKSGYNLGRAGQEIKKLKDKFKAENRIWSADSGLKKPVERFEVTIKKGGITSIRRVVNPDGSKITTKFGGKYIPKDKLCDYSLGVLGLKGKPDGVYEV